MASDHTDPEALGASLDAEVGEIESRLHAIPLEHSIEEHGGGWAFYSGRGPVPGSTNPFEARHGLNLFYITEPDHRWPQVKAFLENAAKDIQRLIKGYDEVSRRNRVLAKENAELRSALAKALGR